LLFFNSKTNNEKEKNENENIVEENKVSIDIFNWIKINKLFKNGDK
jgi:hypothetical protein